MRRAATVSLVIAAVCTAATAEASPQEVLGFGYRSMAMGNTGAAIGEGVDVVYGNPALLSAARDLQLEVGIVGAVFDLHADGGGFPGHLSYTPFRASTIGGILPLPFGGVLEDRVVLGLGFVTPFDVVVRGRILYPEEPQYLLADRVQSVAVQAGLGIDIGYGIRIGGGFAALAALTGSVDVATDATGRIGTTVEDTLVASYAPIVGVSYEFDGPWKTAWRFGLAFRGELVGRFNVVITAADLGALDVPPLNISGVAQYDPWQIAAEAAHVVDTFRFAIGLTYKHWPAYPGPIEATVRCEDAPPDATCTAPQPPDPGYDPVAAPHACVEQRFGPADGVRIDVRGGYAFEPSPAPEQTGRTSWFDNHRHLFSVGFGLRLEDPVPLPIQLDGFAQLQVLQPRSHEKDVAAGALEGGTVDTGGLVLAGGTSLGVRF